MTTRPDYSVGANRADLSLKKLDDIHAVSEAEIALIQRQSALLLQKPREGFNGELKTAGSIVENYVKGLLQGHLPHGYRICSGYIATTDTIRGVENLIQHDIIIVDERVPSLYRFGVGDIEVVAAEAVCGIVEVKRTLTKATLSAAIEQLSKTKKILDDYDDGVKSKNKAMNNAVGVTLSVASHAPMYAIIALDAVKEITETAYFDGEVVPAIRDFLDMIWAPSAPFLSVVQWQARQGGETCVAVNTSRNDPAYEATARPCLLFNFEMKDSGRIYRTAIFSLRTWINNTAGAPMTHAKNLRYFDIIAN